MKIKKGDNIKIIRGKDKGKDGKVEKVFPKIGKVLVANVNLYKRHLKARSEKQPSEIVTLTKPLAMENVALVCSKCHKIIRAGFKVVKDKKIRICKNCDAEIK